MLTFKNTARIWSPSACLQASSNSPYFVFACIKWTCEMPVQFLIQFIRLHISFSKPYSNANMFLVEFFCSNIKSVKKLVYLFLRAPTSPAYPTPPMRCCEPFMGSLPQIKWICLSTYVCSARWIHWRPEFWSSWLLYGLSAGGNVLVSWTSWFESQPTSRISA